MSEHYIAGDMTLRTATIASEASLSGAVYIGKLLPFAILMPAAWTAAAITLQASVDGNTWSDVFLPNNNEYSLTVAAARWVLLDPTYIKGLGPYLKVRSGTAAAAVAQEAERVVSIYVREE